MTSLTLDSFIEAQAPCTGPHPPPNKWADFSQWCEDKEGDVSAFGPNAFGSYGKCTAGGTERRASGGAEGEAVKVRCSKETGTR